MCWITYAVFCAFLSITNCITNENLDMAHPAPSSSSIEEIQEDLEDPCANNNTSLFLEVGQTLYHCLNNTKLIFGCKFMGAILADGDTIIRDNYLLQCQSDQSQNRASMIEIACYVDNRILGPGQIYIDGQEFYTCTWNNETEDLVFEKTGCVDHEKRLVKESQIIVKGYHSYQCMAMAEDPAPAPTMTGSSLIKYRLVKNGCALENYPYKQGRMIIIGDYWYTCEKINNDNEIDYVIKPGGCIVDFGFLNLGEIFHKKGYIYKCHETDEKSADLPSDWPYQKIRRTTVGCLEVTPKKSIIEHSPGDKWIETSKLNQRQKFLVECGFSPEGHQLSKMATECYLDEVKGQLLEEPKSMKPGCIARVKNSLWKCSKNQNDGQLLSTIDEKAGLEETVRAILAGYTFC